MAYERKEISIENIRAQEAICARIREMLTARVGQPLAMVDTYGCQQNEADSEKLRGHLAEMGCGFTQDEFSADIIVVNTCAVREHAEMRVLGNVGQLNHSKKAKPGQIIAVCGCMVQQEHMAEKIKKSYPVVDLVFGPHDLWHFPELLLRVMTGKKRVFATERCDGYVTEGMPLKRDGKVKAWLSVMYGCNNFCTYCIVPYTRGRERSRPKADILREVERAAENGYKEVMLLGQNVNAYGKDMDYRDGDFASLLAEASEIPGLFVVRFMTSHPKDVSDRLIEVIGEKEKVEPHFHLPLQSGSDRVLREMNRRYTSAEYLKIVEKLRKVRPEIALTTDIIVGFPGETEDDFQKTLELVEKARFDAAFTFIYSAREGTPAAERDDQIEREIINDRYRRLTDLQYALSLESNERQIGKTVDVLITGRSETNAEVMSGRTADNRLVHIPLPELSQSPDNAEEYYTNRVVSAEIVAAGSFALEGRLITL